MFHFALNAPNIHISLLQGVKIAPTGKFDKKSDYLEAYAGSMSDVV